MDYEVYEKWAVSLGSQYIGRVPQGSILAHFLFNVFINDNL